MNEEMLVLRRRLSDARKREQGWKETCILRTEQKEKLAKTVASLMSLFEADNLDIMIDALRHIHSSGVEHNRRRTELYKKLCQIRVVKYGVHE